MRLGIQTAMSGCAIPEVANVVDTCINKIYTQLNTKPSAMCKPTPPLIFLEAKDTPMMVRI